MKLRNVVNAVAQFRTALGDQHVRRPSLYSSSDDPEYDEQSIDSSVDACGSADPLSVTNHLVISHSEVQRQTDSSGNRVVRIASRTSKENSDQLVVHGEAAAAGSELHTDSS